MRRLFLHIGAHKTGTTALQQSLNQNRVPLAACGVAYASAPTAAHLHQYLGFVTPGSFLPEGAMVLDPDGMVARLVAERCDTVVASSENFSFFFQRPAIAALAEVLRPHFDEVRIVSYLRRQDRHAVSHHQEGAKPNRHAEGALWGHAPTALPAPSPQHGLYLDYDQRLGTWADVFGPDRIVLRVYDRTALKDGDIFADFLQVIGLDIGELTSVGERNVSLGAAQGKAGHLMNGLGLKPRLAEQILTRIDGGGRLLPSRAEAQAFLEPYRNGNWRLNQRFGVSALPDLFNDDFTDYPPEGDSGWTEAGATSALLAVLTQLGEVSPAVSALKVDDLRLAAQALRDSQPDAALRLIKIAHALRPGGPAIQRLKAELEKVIQPG
jgi:hypothetical protein